MFQCIASSSHTTHENEIPGPRESTSRAGCTYSANATKQVEKPVYGKQTDPNNVPTSTQAASTSNQAIPVSVKAITYHDLDFKGNARLSMGSNGEVIIATVNSRDFYMLEHDGNKYTQKFRKNLHDKMEYQCCKEQAY